MLDAIIRNRWAVQAKTLAQSASEAADKYIEVLLLEAISESSDFSYHKEAKITVSRCRQQTFQLAFDVSRSWWEEDIHTGTN